ncbi:hypothetical protein M434DRAFT_29224 [Hypoxylon sp. CO27-5]|nr:hypothetical protein M434DRAFT_29224 [Hypoxylon sp. CO27-5]
MASILYPLLCLGACHRSTDIIHEISIYSYRHQAHAILNDYLYPVEMTAKPQQIVEQLNKYPTHNDFHNRRRGPLAQRVLSNDVKLLHISATRPDASGTRDEFIGTVTSIQHTDRTTLPAIASDTSCTFLARRKEEGRASYGYVTDPPKYTISVSSHGYKNTILMDCLDCERRPANMLEGPDLPAFLADMTPFSIRHAITNHFQLGNVQGNDKARRAFTLQYQGQRQDAARAIASAIWDRQQSSGSQGPFGKGKTAFLKSILK